jgi:hypothetical protein
MIKRGFNDAERFLLKSWGAASQLEESMVSVRDKYQQLCEQIVEDFRHRHVELDASRVRVTHRSADWGYLWVSKKTWPKDNKSPVGIWVEYIRLEYLADDDEPPPLASLWIEPIKKLLPLEQANAAIMKAAKKLLPPSVMESAVKNSAEGYALGFEFCDKQELLASLVDPERKQFAKRVNEQLDLLAKLAPAVDALLESK